MPIEDKVLRAGRAVLPADASVVVAVSGGCDSTALLFLLHHHAIQLGIRRLVIAHVNYGLRGSDSDADEALVRSFGVMLDRPVVVMNRQGHSMDDPGIEAWARGVRYRFFEEVRSDHGCTFIATGHTLEDQAETILMRLLRGSGMNGLRGIASMREDNVVRPLLEMRKSELAQWLDEKGIPYRYDHSNRDTRFLRNRIRHELLPLLEEYNPHAIRHIASIASEARSILRLQQEQVDAWIADNSCLISEDALWIRRTAATDSALAGEALRQLLVRLGCVPDRDHVAMIVAMSAGEGKTVLLPGGWSCTAGKTVLYVQKKRQSIVAEVNIPSEELVYEGICRITVSELSAMPAVLDAGKSTVYCNGDLFGSRLILRSVREDDVFIPFGRRNPVNVTKFLAAQGMVLADREHAMILVTGDNKPVWVFGIRLDERFRVDTATKRVIKVQSSSISV